MESDDYSEGDVDQGETDDLYDDDGTSGTETDSGSLSGFVTQGSTSTDTEDSGDDSSNQTDGDDEDDPVTTTSTNTTIVNYVTGAYSIAETDSFHSTATDGDSNNGSADLRSVFHIHFVGVRSDACRAGPARALYRNLVEHARAKGCTEVRAVTAAANADPMRLQKRPGCTVGLPVADHDGPGRPTATFRRDPAPPN